MGLSPPNPGRQSPRPHGKSRNYGCTRHRILESKACPGPQAAPAIKFCVPSSVHMVAIQVKDPFFLSLFFPFFSHLCCFLCGNQCKEENRTGLIGSLLVLGQNSTALLDLCLEAPLAASLSRRHWAETPYFQNGGIMHWVGNLLKIVLFFKKHP